MKMVTDGRFLGIISRIRETEEMIKMWQKSLPDPAANFMVLQFEDLKHDFVKQLLAELLQSQHNISDIEPFIRRATSYLKKFDRKDNPAKELKANLREVEGMMIVAHDPRKGRKVVALERT